MDKQEPEKFKKPNALRIAKALIKRELEAGAYLTIIAHSAVTRHIDDQGMMRMKDMVIHGFSSKMSEIEDDVSPEMRAKFQKLWKALEKVASGEVRMPDDNAILVEGPALIGQVLRKCQGELESLRKDLTADGEVEVRAAHMATSRKTISDLLGIDIENAGKVTANDYRRAQKEADQLKESMDGFDSSPRLLGELQADLIAINKGLGLGKRELK